MRKILAVLICAATLLTLCACGKSESKPATSYDAVIDKLSSSVDSMFTENFEEKVSEGAYSSPTGELPEKWNNMLIDATKDFRNLDENAFGYKLVDLNSDGVSELFFVRSDDKVLAIFTMCEGAPVLVDAFERDYQCVIRDSGEVYTMTAREDGGYDHKIHTLNSSSGTYYTTVAFGTEGNINYEVIDGMTYTTSSERIIELRAEYEFKMSTAFTDMEFHLF